MRGTLRLCRLESLRSKSDARHEQDVGAVAEALARAMGMDAARAACVGHVGRFHDLGKMALPDAVLQKPGALSQAEFELVKLHTKFGHELLVDGEDDPLQSLAADVALRHHEHYDGTGYPSGLAGTAIPIEARIVAVADTYSALREPRPYKPAISHPEALRLILNGDSRISPEQYDPEVLRCFSSCERRIRSMYGSGAGVLAA